MIMAKKNSRRPWTTSTNIRQPTQNLRAQGKPRLDLAAVLTQAVQALQAGNLQKAEKFAKQALQQSSDNADVHLVMATVQQNLDRSEDAERHYLECLRLDASNLRALINLGMLQLNQERGDEAVANLEHALQLNSGVTEARHYLARAYGLCGRYQDAIDQFLLVERSFPNSPDVLMGLGKALRAAARTDEAIDVLKRASSLKQNDKRICRDLGLNHAELGDFDEAEKWLREAIRIAPFETDAYIQLSIIRRLTADDVEFLESNAENGSAVSDPIRASYYYAIGSYFDQHDDPERAFDALTNANAIMDEKASFDHARITAHYQRLTEVTDKATLAEGPTGNASDKPIFIVGMPRSGTTLVEQILAGHPNVHAAGELEAMAQCAQAVMDQTSDRLLSVDELGRPELRQLAANYMEQLPPEAAAAVRVTDKLPGNVAYLPLIARVFPNARIILCRRHPMDVAWSVYKNSFSSNMAYATNLRHIIDVQKLTGGFMDLWTAQMPDRSLDVLYEEVVGDFEAAARRIVAFAGLEWDNGCLESNSVSRTVRTASMWQVRQPVYTSSVRTWRRYAEQLADVEAEMGEHIASYERMLEAVR